MVGAVTPRRAASRRLGGALATSAVALGLALTSPAMAATSASQAFPRQVKGPEISMLVRTTIVALHQANLTANYSVLRDLGDRRFQSAYSQATLSDMFRGFRQQAISLGPAVLYDADLDQPPRLTTDGLLRVVGHFPTAPLQIIFDMTFALQDGMWRIDQLDAGVRRAPPVALAPLPPAAATVSPSLQQQSSAVVRPAPRPDAGLPTDVQLAADTPSFQ